ncbi:hypothetical protein D3C85_16260 [compost metagenome]
MGNDQTVRRFPRFASHRSIPNEVKAAISKLGADPHGAAGARNNIRLPDSRVMAQVANTTIGNIQDARNLFQVLPDMDYARQILISATISPGDLTDTKVLYSVEDRSLDSNLTGPLLRNTQEFFDNSYRIRSLLHPILNDTMFETGSYPLLVLPESAIDRIINSDNYNGISMEAAVEVLDAHMRQETDGNGHYNPWGILGSPVSGKAPAATDSYTGVSFESINHNNTYQHDVTLSGVKVSFEGLMSNVKGMPDDENIRTLRTSLESLGKTADKMISSKGSTIQVTDNINILKRPMVIETRRRLATRRIYGGKLRSNASLESRAKTGDQEAIRNLAAVEKSLYTKRHYKHIPVQPIMTHAQTGTETYGHPLVVHLPSESVIPIHVPGNPAEHVGYYVLLDIDGNPISVADMTSYLDDIRNQMNNADSQASQIINQARRGFEGMGGIHNEIIDEMARVHSEAVEADLLSRLRAGALSGNYELGKTENINRIMLSRHLKGQKTMMLFVPAELMVYIAFDYNEYGVGKSILEDGKILGSIRAALMLANTLATINNAVGGKTINITLDPDDEDPVGTVEFLLSEHAKVNAQGFSRIVGSTHPIGLADQIQNHGVNVVVTGNTRYPETTYDVSQRDGTARPVDADMEKVMADRHARMFGLSPEMMDGSNQSDFATTVVQNNLMLLKRVIQNQEKFEPFLTDFVRRYVLNSGIFIDEMRELVKDNVEYLPEDLKKDTTLDDAAKVDEFIFRFISALTVTLPSPEIGDVKKQMEQFQDYTDALDKVIDAYLSEEMFATDTTIGMEELLPNVKAVVKAEFQRRWLRKYNIMSELDVFNTVNEEEDTPAFSLLEASADHLDGLNNSIAMYVKKVIEAANGRATRLKAINDAKEKLNAAKEEAGGALDGGDDLGGSDDTGGGEDLSMDEGADGGDEFSLDETVDDTASEDTSEGGEEETPEADADAEEVEGEETTADDADEEAAPDEEDLDIPDAPKE